MRGRLFMLVFASAAACVSPRNIAVAPPDGSSDGPLGDARDAPPDLPRDLPASCEGNACPTRCGPCSAPQNADPSCNGGTCGFVCRMGFHECSGACIANAVHCAGKCLPGWLLCAGGVCVEGTCCDDGQCGLCQKCEGGSCRNQEASEDRKNECAMGACRTGSCDGKGACDVRVAGPDPSGICKATDCRTGECEAGGNCQAAASDKPGPGCMGTCQVCQAGTCKDVGPLITCYRDFDGDGYGDKSDTKQGCNTCPNGYVKNDTDCYDRNKLAHPPDFFDQPYQATHRGDGSFDYDCDGKLAKNPNAFHDTCVSRMGAYCTLSPTLKTTVDIACGTLIPDYYCQYDGTNGTCVNRNAPVMCL
jgi:hypothetical protein